MKTRYSRSKLMLSALLFLMLVNITVADRQTRTPARILAKQTGATQFEEERFEAHTDCNDHKHHLKKRASDEDIDYEVYQGVVGRPGIDFPIYPRIPKTTFSCRSFGNGYFADMETDCQVFHICEEGRKISFLCPNGTIFQQSELTCDWWFKVNCLGSPGYYAESAEILNKQRVHRVRPSVPVQGFNIVGGGLNIKPKSANNAPRSRNNNKSDRRIDSNEEPSLESVDFDDVSAEKQLKGQKSKGVANIDNNNNNEHESQITAESASFVDGNRRNSYTYERPTAGARRGNGDRGSQRNGYANLQNGGRPDPNTESNERARNGQRGQSRFREDKKPLAESFESNESKESKKSILPEKIIQPVDGSAKSISGSNILALDDVKPEFYDASTARSTPKGQITTPIYPSGTYSTARRLDTTRSTPFYTPTVPAVAKSKSTEGKSYYIKAGKSGATATTPNPNRFSNGGNGGGASAGLFPESSAAPKPSSTESASEALESIYTSTFKPIIIGMRHHYDTSPELHRVSVSSSAHFDADLPNQKANKKTESRDYLPTTTANPRGGSTGPTYLPKSSATPKASLDDASGGDLLLFAPIPTSDDAVARNVNDMLKTINMIKDKLADVEEVKFQGQARAGLEIPPSSGPDALVSLAQYFAGEQNGSTAKSLNSLDVDEKERKRLNAGATTQSTLRLSTLAQKPSDKTAFITTSASPAVSSNADDIKTSLLSNRTVAQYSNLFGLKDPKSRLQGTDLSAGLLSNVNNTSAGAKDASTNAFNNFPQIGTTGATIRQLAEKPESRKIAQVFSNALTTYLEDPESFRTQLASVRPTEPPVGGKANFDPVVTTDSTLFRAGTAASYLPTRPTSAVHITTTPSSIASEINNKFDYSTPLPELASTTELFDTTTYRPSFIAKNLQLELSGELVPPGPDSGENDEFLQREQTQSFVKSRNDLSSKQEDAKQAQKTNAAYTLGNQKTATAKPTENPWNHISQTDYLDPLTINDALMKEARTTTPSPFTYLPKASTTQLPKTATHGNLNVLSGAAQRSSSSRIGSAEETTKHTPHSGATEPNSWQDIFSTYDLPRDTLPSSNGLQRIANKLFGGLNESEALHLKNVMQQAEHNRQVLSLLLLLIQTCDDQNGKALERSRKHLLNALIDMDGKLQLNGKTAHHKGAAAVAGPTTTRVPVTTYRRNGDELTTTQYAPTTTDTASTTVSSIEETTKFEIRVEEPDEHFAASTIVSSTQPSASSDKRALELLKSLYSLASKFTSSR